MRIWTLHPRHLDPIGLVALWREALLAQAVLLGRTRGYTKHPQLSRFRASTHPISAIVAYLLAVQAEATSRGYSFQLSRVAEAHPPHRRIAETRGQLEYEWAHFTRKVRVRNPVWYREHCRGILPAAHPLFHMTAGGIRQWEHLP